MFVKSEASSERRRLAYCNTVYQGCQWISNMHSTMKRSVDSVEGYRNCRFLLSYRV